MTFEQEQQKSQEEWYEQGFEQGKKEGIMIAKRRAIYGMYGKGYPLSDIAVGLNLSNDEVKNNLF